MISAQDRRSKKVPEIMTLCSLSFMGHARLFSVASETLIEYSPRYFYEDVKHINHINIGNRRCLKKRIELLPREEWTVDVVPCTVNQYLGNPQFFVLADIKIPDAAFILTMIGKPPKIKLRA